MIWIFIEVCVICRSQRCMRQITQTEALVIPHILREPNSIIVLLFTKRSANISLEEVICIFPVLIKPSELYIGLNDNLAAIFEAKLAWSWLYRIP